MLLQLLRGHVKDLTSSGKRGEADCQIGQYNVSVHGDLVSCISNGNDVLLACTHLNGIYRALAVRNIDTGKITQIDYTNCILIMVASGFISLFGFALAADAYGENNNLFLASISTGLIGMGLFVVTLRRFFFIARAGNWVRYTNL